MDEIVQIDDGMAVVNVTYSGQNGDLHQVMSYNAPDADVKAAVFESLRGGDIKGVDPVDTPEIDDFVVDRFPAKDDLPNRLVVRPKVPFGDS